jgi:hypothetical protein
VPRSRTVCQQGEAPPAAKLVEAIIQLRCILFRGEDLNVAAEKNDPYLAELYC